MAGKPAADQAGACVMTRGARGIENSCLWRCVHPQRQCQDWLEARAHKTISVLLALPGPSHKGYVRPLYSRARCTARIARLQAALANAGPRYSHRHTGILARSRHMDLPLQMGDAQVSGIHCLGSYGQGNDDRDRHRRRLHALRPASYMHPASWRGCGSHHAWAGRQIRYPLTVSFSPLVAPICGSGDPELAGTTR
jgi:hypothetical protein